MAEIATAPPTSDDMQGVAATDAPLAETAPAAVAPPPEEPENACETLYIQNLNEKIKTDGKPCEALLKNVIERFYCLVSPQSIFTRPVQIVRGGP